MMVVESSAQRGKKNELTNSVDSISYAFGISIAKTVKQQNIPELNLEKLLKGIEDVFGEQETKLTVEHSQTLLNEYISALKEKLELEKLEEMAKFLDENKKDPGVVTLPSGLQYKVLREGTGQSPMPKSKVKTHYKGTLLDGTVFDSSYDRGEPVEFGVNQVIRGWQEALVLMKPGAKWMLYIPPYLGYGDRDSGPIPANSILIFEIELLSVE
ncbi:MAG: FKBP-type peptidyl-prolyl cis-trans isomerase [Bacteroidales bacterium]|nr:FKBP-type peptidyl-prolyl cis-trans isomerase [Bacteroidales bacterium]